MEQEDLKDLILPHTVPIDIMQKKLDYQDEDEIHEENLKFANLFISNLEDSDFQFLWEEYFAYKNQLTEEATVDSINAHFDYEEVEYNGLMSAYNDILPYGDQLLAGIKSMISSYTTTRLKRYPVRVSIWP